GSLAEVAVELDDPEMRIGLRDLDQALERSIAAAVVHEHELVGAAGGARHLRQLRVQRADVPFLVVDRDDERQGRAWLGRTHQSKNRRTVSATRSTSASL